MESMLTSEAAEVLGISPDKLRRWVREGRFDDIPGMKWDDSGFKPQRLYTQGWVQAVADKLGRPADFSRRTRRA